MKVQKLLELLSEYSPEAEVRLLRQPHYPVESTLIGVVSASELRRHEERDLRNEAEVVYLLEGQPGDASPGTLGTRDGD